VPHPLCRSFAAVPKPEKAQNAQQQQQEVFEEEIDSVLIFLKSVVSESE
jgi:hypothetical protein